MITKILLTLTVIAIAFALIRLRSRPVSTRPARIARQEPRPLWIRWAAMAVVSITILASAAFLYVYWRDSNQVVQVRVIDSQSGRSVSYQVYRGQLDERSFQTTDGRRITLANSERMEVGAAP